MKKEFIKALYDKLEISLRKWKGGDESSFSDVCESLSIIVEEWGKIADKSGKQRCIYIQWEDIKQHILLLFITNKENLKMINLEHENWRSYISKTIYFYFHRCMKPTKRPKNTKKGTNAGYSYNYSAKDLEYMTKLNDSLDDVFIEDTQ